MHDEPHLPPHVRLLGEALRPLALKFRAQMNYPTRATNVVSGMGEIVSRHMNELQVLVGVQLPDSINRLMSDVVANDRATDADVYRAVGQLEGVLDALLAGHRRVRSLNVHARDAEARGLLEGVYRHTLTQLGSFLAEVIKALANPDAARRRRGLPMVGPVELDLVLKLTPAPQMAALTRWAQSQSGAVPDAEVEQSKSGSNFWSAVWWGALAAVLFGGCDGE